jgi:uncharacterized protein with GYD domain
MAHYVILMNFTDQGAKTARDTVKRYRATKEMAAKAGVHFKDVYWLQGQYDVLVHVEANDEKAATMVGLAVAAQGNVRTNTMRAFTESEMEAMLAKLG